MVNTQEQSPGAHSGGQVRSNRRSDVTIGKLMKQIWLVAALIRVLPEK